MKAFPQQLVFVGEKTDGSYESLAKGMDLRDYFAAKAMQAYIGSEILPIEFKASHAMHAYQIADDMMKAREK
jgi:hypothetical protein